MMQEKKHMMRVVMTKMAPAVMAMFTMQSSTEAESSDSVARAAEREEIILCNNFTISYHDYSYTSAIIILPLLIM